MSMNINWKLPHDLLKLPHDIVKLIFSKLPFSNLPNCRIVCKVWNDLVLDYANSSPKLFHPPNALICISDFVSNRNPKMQCIDFDTSTRSVATLSFNGDWNFVLNLSSCNGLLHIYKGTYQFWRNIIWNPMTNEFIQLPGLERNIYAFGFGFSLKTKQYKLFRATIDEYKLICIIEVWRFGIKNEWNPLCLQPFSIHYNSTTYLDGVIYWIGKNMSNEFVIYALDVETETFETIAILNVGPYSPRYHTYFQPFNDTICLIIKMPEPIWKVQVWIMRAKHSWIKEFDIDLPNDVSHQRFHLIKTFEGEQMLYFLVNNDLFYFDKSRNKIKIKTLFNPNETKIESIFHIESYHFGSLSKILAVKD